jgi:hypothetical protein
MKATSTTLGLAMLLASSALWADTMVCPMVSVPNTMFIGLGSTAELCGPDSITPDLTLEVTGSNMVTASTLARWMGLDGIFFSTTEALYGQGVAFRGFQATAGAELAVQWALSFPVDVGGTLFYVFNGQVGVIGTDTSGAGVTSAGVLRLTTTTTGTQTLALGLVNTLTTSGVGSTRAGVLERLQSTGSGPVVSLTGGSMLTSAPFAETPEPSTMALTGVLLIALGALRRPGR